MKKESAKCQNQRQNIAGLKTLSLIGFGLLSAKELRYFAGMGKFFKKSSYLNEPTMGFPILASLFWIMIFSAILDSWSSSNDRFEIVETFWLKFSSIISESLVSFRDMVETVLLSPFISSSKSWVRVRSRLEFQIVYLNSCTTCCFSLLTII